jgi:hypothetical protein
MNTKQAELSNTGGYISKFNIFTRFQLPRPIQQPVIGIFTYVGVRDRARRKPNK